MQVFLPFSDFQMCAESLDHKRLVKQLLEGRQIMAALAGETKGWVNHPATRMFKGAEHELFDYLFAIRNEMAVRHFAYETNWNEIRRIVVDNRFWRFNESALSHWIYDTETLQRVNVTHQAALYRKDPDHYADFRLAVTAAEFLICCPERCGYYWPTHDLTLVTR